MGVSPKDAARSAVHGWDARATPCRGPALRQAAPLWLTRRPDQPGRLTQQHSRENPIEPETVDRTATVALALVLAFDQFARRRQLSLRFSATTELK